jgi:hypothetical protein
VVSIEGHPLSHRNHQVREALEVAFERGVEEYNDSYVSHLS